jgi:hypothetical protein
MRHKLRQAYRDWFNNFLTVPVFAQHYGVSVERAERMIRLGRVLHNREAEMLKRSCWLTDLIKWSENNC